jgi:hypothetical protein
MAGPADSAGSSLRELAERVTRELAGSSQGLLRELGLVTEREHAELELRVAQLEHRLRLLERRLEGDSQA